ncbi:hypothetical protein BAE44_0001517, partial [Dichanthelium oligosanthes]
LDLNLLGRALRLRWLWSNRVRGLRYHPCFPSLSNSIAQAFFNASIRCEVGDGTSTLFWSDPWLDGRCVAASSPDLVEAVPAWRKNRHSVASALQEHDQVIWKWCASGQYSCSSAYQAMFLGQTALAGAKVLWKVKAPNEYRFFFWLVLHDRCWTSDRLHRHGLRNNASCAFCCQHDESIDHLLLGCVFSREVWFQTLLRAGWQHLVPALEDSLPNWWLLARKKVTKMRRKTFDSLCLLLSRQLWLEQNNRVFRNGVRLPGLLVGVILEQTSLWSKAGLLDSVLLFGG